MSTVTQYIDCPRLFFEDGKPTECGCQVEIEIEIDGLFLPATRYEPAEAPTVSLLNIPTTCAETDEAYTLVELLEVTRRGERAAEKYDVEEADRA